MEKNQIDLVFLSILMFDLKNLFLIFIFMIFNIEIEIKIYYIVNVK